MIVDYNSSVLDSLKLKVYVKVKRNLEDILRQDFAGNTGMDKLQYIRIFFKKIYYLKLEPPLLFILTNHEFN